MISRSHQFIFIHIPKTAGNSIQNVLRHYSDDAISIHGATLGEVETLLDAQERVVIDGPVITRGATKFVTPPVTVTDINALEDFGVQNDVLGTKKHSLIKDYFDNWDEELFGKFGDYFKFSVIRNPWDRMISYYWSPCFNMKSWDQQKFRRMLDVAPTDFHYISLDGEVKMEYLIRYDKLQTDFDAVCKMIGIGTYSLPVTNKSDKRPYTEYYDAELQRLVAQKFRKEIDYFNFEFGS